MHIVLSNIAKSLLLMYPQEMESAQNLIHCSLDQGTILLVRFLPHYFKLLITYSNGMW